MNIVTLVLNGCPAGWLGAYGNEWVATPDLDRLAAEGVVFDRHVADCPDPAAAGRAWRTGRGQVPPLEAPAAALSPSPLVGEGRDRGSASLGQGVSTPHPNPPPQEEREQEVLPAADLLARLYAAGIHTALVRASRPANDAPAEFYAGWGEVFDARPDPADPSPSDALLRTLPAVLVRLAEHPRWFLWVEIDRLLPPWDVPPAVFAEFGDDPPADDTEEPDAESEDEDEEDVDAETEDDPEPDADDLDEADEPLSPWTDPPAGRIDVDDTASIERLQRSFAAAVTAFDADLGRVFDLFRNRGLDESAAWVVTADYGFPLGEHGMIGRHRPWLHEELVHIPLVVRLPGAAEAGRRVAALTQPADLHPTWLRLLGVEPDPGGGFDLAPLWSGAADVVRECAVSGLVLGGAAEWAIRTDEWAFVLPAPPHPEDGPRLPMLFQKPDDRWEVNDLRSREVERAEELEARLRAAAGDLRIS